MRVIFLQNVITDLVLGYDVKEVFLRYCDFIRKKYNVIPGFITLNLPYLKAKLEEWGIEEVVICSSINKAGFNMFPSKEEYEKSSPRMTPTNTSSWECQLWHQDPFLLKTLSIMSIN